MRQLSTYRDVIDLWKTRGALAKQARVPAATVRNWYRRDSIPHWDFELVADAARKCGFDGVTYAVLSAMVSGAALQPPAGDRDDGEA